ncbi:hypothetical protein D3C76_1348090 [compost metagenome]
MGDTVGPGLRRQDIDIASRARRTGRQQNGLKVSLFSNDFCSFPEADHLGGGLLRFEQTGKGNIQRHAERPQGFEAGVAVPGLQLREC